MKKELTTLPGLRYSSGHRKGRLKILFVRAVERIRFSCHLRLLGCAIRLCPKPSLELLSIALLVFACAPAAAQPVPVSAKPVRTFEGHTRGIVSIAFSL